MKAINQAQEIYGLCVEAAQAKSFLTYRRVLHRLGYNSNVGGHAIRYGLELVWIACAKEGLPVLTSIIVNQATGEPTKSGYDVPDWRKNAEKVFAHKEWPNVDAIDWDYVWENRKVLSDTYGTRGYW